MTKYNSQLKFCAAKK